ncbi:MAG: hypothetical protein A4E36_02156 [Methanoregulaceae archaeon PtaB.Bin009]|nr:MAG: hypothetical protein A4E36_02156 [Methanoregulaceae archaeon PtaB.Bin009]
MDFGRDECEGDAPAGIRTRVGSSGGSQDIHYPTGARERRYRNVTELLRFIIMARLIVNTFVIGNRKNEWNARF